MTTTPEASTVLKILSGVQAGTDIALTDGDYTVGRGDDDDIQLFDVSLLVGHLKIRLNAGRARVAGAAGSVVTQNGVTLEPGSGFQELEPLDIVTVGTSRFALGPRTANWASIASSDGFGSASPEQEPEQAKPGPAGRSISGLLTRSHVLMLGTAALMLVIAAFGTGYVSRGDGAGHTVQAAHVPDTETVEQALTALPFRDRLEVREELDGVIYISGFVEKPVERRAILAAVRETGVPVRLRVTVVEILRSEITHLLNAEGMPVSSDVSLDGTVTLGGVLLDEDRARSIPALLRERVPGIGEVVSEIVTGPALLAEVTDLAQRSQITPLVLLRLDRSYIEASGMLPRDKIDAWAGFLQSYASRYAPTLPLRSVVSLEPEQGQEGPASASPPLVLGNGDVPPGGGRAMDINRVNTGQFDITDIFVGSETAAGPLVSAAASGSGEAGQGPEDALKAALPGGAPLDLRRLASGAAGRSAAGIDLRGQSPAGIDPGGRSDMPAVPTSAAASAALSRDAPDDPAGGVFEAALPDGAPLDLRRLARGVAEGIGQRGRGDTPMVPTNEASSRIQLRDEGTDPAGGAASVRRVGIGTAAGMGDTEQDIAAADDPGDGSVGASPGSSAAPEPGADDDFNLTRSTRLLFEQWRSGALDTSDAQMRRLQDGFDQLDARSREEGAAAASASLETRYAPLMASDIVNSDGRQACWEGARLTRSDVVGVVFMLDLLSVSEMMSVRSLDTPTQALLLEAAFNPANTGRCLEAASAARMTSIYLDEVANNRSFVRYLTRELEPFPLDVAGVSVGSDRYVLARSGGKMRRGSAPDANSRVAIVGELGVAVRRPEGYAAVIFDDTLDWLIR